MTSWPGRFARWMFTDRDSGEIVVAQRPNWSLIGFGIATVLAWSTDGGVSRLLGWVAAAFLAVWGLDELVRGVNPWRRLLGVGVLGAVVFGRL